MRIQCVHCGKQYSLRDENAGSQFACRSCGKISPLSPATAGAEQRVVPAAPAVPAENGAALVETQCRHCGKQYKLKPQAAGMQFKCKQCGRFSPAAPAAAHAAKIAPAVRARPAAEKPKPVEPLIAVPVEPPRAIPLKSGPAPLAALPLEPLPSGPSDMLDLLNEAQSPSTASPYAQPLGVGPEVARPLPPKVVGRKKGKRKSAASDQPSVMLRILGGVAMMAIGLAFAGFAAHSMRRPGRVIVLGVCVAAAGFKLMLGLNSDD